MRFLFIFFMLISCASREAAPRKQKDLLKDCLYREVGNWEDTSHNFGCISKIHHSVSSLLKQGNSPQALKLSRMGLVQYPFDDRIKNQFKETLEIYKSVTLKLTDCTAVHERVKFLRLISPDTPFDVDACPVPLETNRVVIDDITLLRGPRKLEIREFQNISGTLKYMVQKNTEDNFDHILYKGLESVDIIHRSVKFDVPDATDENNFSLKVETKILMDQKIDETCIELAREYNFPEGKPVSCGIQKLTNLLLGKKDFDNLSVLHETKSLIHGFIPTNSIFVVEFIYEGRKKNFYYFDNAFDDDKYPRFDATTPILEGTKTKQGYSYVFKNLTTAHVEGLKRINFTFNRLLTFKMYSKSIKENKPVFEIWADVVKENTK